MSSVTECGLCGAVRSVHVHQGARYAPDLEARRCEGCGLVYLWPLPDESQLQQYYATAYRDEYGEEPWEDGFRAGLEEARERCRRVRPLLRPNARLLEVGCGSGAFLDAVRPLVAEARGVEPGAAWREKIVGMLKLPVSASLAELPADARFDVIVAYHVLEHVRRPVDFLRELGRLLNPSGCLVVEVPNVEDALVSVYQIPAYLPFYYQKAHLYYFSPATLAKALEQAGFTAAVKGVQRYDLSNHLRWMLTGRPGGAGHYDWLLLDSAKAAYAESLIRSGHADTLWAVARRA